MKVTSVEAFTEASVEVSVEVTSVEDSISPMEASTLPWKLP